MAKKRREQAQRNSAQRRNSSLSAHQRHGKTLTPPLMSLPNVKLVGWELDVLPDYLLMSAYLLDEEPKATHRLIRLLTVIDKVREATGGSPGGSGAQAAIAQASPEAEPSGSTTTPAARGAGQTAPESKQGAVRESSVLTGRLTEFEDFSAEDRKAVLDALLDAAVYEDLVPEHVFHILGMYPGAPGEWLLKPWQDRGLRVDPEVSRHSSRAF